MTDFVVDSTHNGISHTWICCVCFLTETKLFHFHRIFKNGEGAGRGVEGVQANPLNPLCTYSWSRAAMSLVRRLESECQVKLFITNHSHLFICVHVLHHCVIRIKEHMRFLDHIASTRNHYTSVKSHRSIRWA